MNVAMEDWGTTPTHQIFDSLESVLSRISEILTLLQTGPRDWREYSQLQIMLQLLREDLLHCQSLDEGAYLTLLDLLGLTDEDGNGVPDFLDEALKELGIDPVKIIRPEVYFDHCTPEEASDLVLWMNGVIPALR